MNIPTVDDFILFYGELESVEISNLENASEGSVDRCKIQNALDTAYEFVMSYDSLCQLPGKIALRRAIKRLNLDIARYFLDTLQRREDVTTNYQNCIDFLSLCIENKSDGLTLLSDEEAEELGLSGINKAKLSYKAGRRAFTDLSLSKYRNQELYR
jgi:phage gp36-like protein